METLARYRAPLLGAYVLCAFVLAAVAGCGGGGSGGSAAAQNPAPPPAPTAAPTIGGTPTAQATAGQPYSFTPTTTDPSGGMLSFSVQNLPTWATFSSATGTLSGTPSSSDVGTFANIIISVNDGPASASLTPFSISVAAPLPSGSGNVTLAWVAPTTNADGTPLTDLAGYTINYGNSPSAMNQTVQIASAAGTSYTIQNLSAGSWYFSVTAYTSVGTKSPASNVASVTIS